MILQKTVKQLTVVFVIVVVMQSLTVAQFGGLDRRPPALPDLQLVRTRGGDSTDPMDKLSPELRSLYEQISNVQRGSGTKDDNGLDGFTASQLTGIFGISPGNPDPLVIVSVRFTSQSDLSVLKSAGASIIAQSQNVAYAIMPVKALNRLANVSSVSAIGVFTAMQMPSPVASLESPETILRERGGSTTTNTARLANDFDKQKMTGKGVIIGIIDSGIDWRHEDFRRPDGKSRILAIWDLMDDSYQTTNGGVGSKPPVYLERDKKWLGTVYTNEQIDKAINGNGTVNSLDKFGHGTAVAGTAASNGRATANGIPAGTYAGVAPDAELIIVKAMDCNYFFPGAELTAEWIFDYARGLNKPVVVNMSFGSQFGPHDGTVESEQFIDSIVGPAKAGKIITVSAGNDGRYNVHANGTFAPKRKSQADQFSAAIDLAVKSPAQVISVFDGTDDWGIAFRSSNPIFVGTDDKPVSVFIYKNNGALDYEASSPFKNPDQAQLFFDSLRASFANPGVKTDVLQLQLPTGNYVFWDYGTGANVNNGRFDLYSVESSYLNKATFGMGTRKTEIVSSPGNAKNAITVGSFDFRSIWENTLGETTLFNLLVGGASSYTSAGFRRDGVVKPDTIAPGRYTISSLSHDAQPITGGCKISMATGDGVYFTKDGNHLAWEGTSASSPFTAGVIALILQKNPTLDSEQIRQILKRSAKSGGTIGAVPNPIWGWGMIDPEAAIKATPLRNRTPSQKKP